MYSTLCIVNQEHRLSKCPATRNMGDRAFGVNLTGPSFVGQGRRSANTEYHVLRSWMEGGGACELLEPSNTYPLDLELTSCDLHMSNSKVQSGYQKFHSIPQAHWVVYHVHGVWSHTQGRSWGNRTVYRGSTQPPRVGRRRMAIHGAVSAQV